MNRKSLIIGLGLASDSILKAISQCFSDNDWLGQSNMVHEMLSMIWLTETEAPEEPWHRGVNLQQMTLDLTSKDLNNLYFQRPDIRVMSAANWKEWPAMGALIGTRLHGFLALRAHYTDIHTLLSTESNRLGRQKDPIGEEVLDQQLQYFVVAHLHDAFATGMLIDFVYLLQERVASIRKAPITGILLLPSDLKDDPLFFDTTELERNRLQASVYAIMRELQFYRGASNFYRNHITTPSISVTNKRIFSPGDCFLIGTDLNARGENLPYEEIVRRIAQYVYVHIASSMAESIPYSASPNLNNGMFSSFGISVSRHEMMLNARRRQQNIVDMLYTAVTETDEVISTLDFDSLARLRLDYHDKVEEPPSLATFRRRRVDLEEDDVEKYETQLIDEDFRQFRQGMVEFERTLNDIVEEILRENKSQLLDKLDEIWAGMHDSLGNVKKLHIRLFELFEAAHEESIKNVERLEQEAKAASELLRLRRGLFQLTLSRHGHRVDQGLATFVFASFTWLFVIAPIPDLTLPIWLGVFGYGVFLAPRQGRRDRMNAAFEKFKEAESEAGELQYSLILARAARKYTNDMLHYCRKQLNTQQGNLRMSELVSTMQQLIVEFRRQEGIRTPNNLIRDTSQRRTMTERYLSIIRTSRGTIQDELVSEDIAGANGAAATQQDEQNFRQLILARTQDVLEALDAQNAVRADMEHIVTLAQRVRDDATPMLQFDSNYDNGQQIGQPDDQIGMVRYSQQEREYLQQNLRNQSYRRIELLEAGQVNNPKLVVVRIRPNIPLRFISVVSLMRSHYEDLVGERVSGQRTSIYARFHPTRAGMASPTPQSEGNGQMQLLPQTAMILTMLLHTGHTPTSDQKRRTLSNDYLQIQETSPPDYDQLCAALQMVLSTDGTDLWEMIRQMPIPEDPLQLIDQTLTALRALAPIASSEYADWEVFALYQLITDVADWRQVDQRTGMLFNLSALQQLARLIVYAQGQ